MTLPAVTMRVAAGLVIDGHASALAAVGMPALAQSQNHPVPMCSAQMMHTVFGKARTTAQAAAAAEVPTDDGVSACCAAPHNKTLFTLLKHHSHQQRQQHHQGQCVEGLSLHIAGRMGTLVTFQLT
jgi:hypothetical protein